ncbi:LLM class flavin-dependent oxidoreductase [Streptosporangium lutulentum]
MRFGLFLNEPKGPDALSKLRERVARGADEGFSSAWVSNIFGLDALTALAVVGSQVPGIELGTGVVPTYPRHPAALAQQALTVNAAVDGRLALGIGLSHQMVIEGMYGYSFDKPARHMREYLSVLMPLVRGEKASFEGRPSRRTSSCRHRARGTCPCSSPRWPLACSSWPARWPTARCCG